MRICSIEGCNGKHASKGLCQKHYDALPDRKAKRNASTVIYHTRRRKSDPAFRIKDSAIRHMGRARRRKVDPAFRVSENAQIHRCQRRRYKTDPLFCSRVRISACISQSFRSHSLRKESPTLQILGCESYEQARQLIGWFPGCEIHHISWTSTATSTEEVIRFNHWTNLIALTPEEHRAIHAGIFELIPRTTRTTT